MPVGFTGPPRRRAGPRDVPSLTGVFAPFRAKPDDLDLRGTLKVQLTAWPLTIC